MFTYQSITQKCGPTFRRYYETCNYGLCEYTFGTKLMWKDHLNPEWTEAAGCLIVRNHVKGEYFYDYPVPGPEGDVDEALRLIEMDAFERENPLIISIVPECESVRLLHRYPYVHVRQMRTWNDYIYRAENLMKFSGRHYNGQRNHINKFEKKYPHVEFRVLESDDMEAINQFWEEYEAEFTKSGIPLAMDELNNSKRMMKLAGKSWFRAGAFWDGERIVALSLAEKSGNTLVIHIEKALYSYEGIYPAFVRAFAGKFAKDCEFINREDDAADPGLRRSKMQYRPTALAPKYIFRPHNDLQERGREIPALETDRLTLDAMTEADIPVYNQLVLDKERNKWWGYDDLGSLTEPYTERSFFNIAMRDWENRMAINFAIRLDGRMIGEAVLYNFDFRGGAELGARIDKAFAGHGYGVEAFQAVANWALYELCMVKVKAKCYHENEASFKMLSSVMRNIGSDETFQYFEKLL